MGLKFKFFSFGIALAVTLTAITIHFLGDPGQAPGAVVIAPVALVTSPSATIQPSAKAPDPVQNVPIVTRHTANSLELSRDLRAIYDQFKNSNDPAERYTAYRAWTACFPTFVTPNGQLASIDALTRALPKDGVGIVDRENAYRALQSRCTGFSGMNREEILEATRNQHAANNKGTLISPGEVAERFLTEGNKEAALKTMQAIVATGDPFAISSLREFVNQFIVLRVDAQAVHSDERPDLRSLAFTLAACDLGLECGPSSLTALQLCTSMGECAGSVADRYRQALPTQADREAIAIETRRVLSAIKSGDFKGLGLQ